MRLITLQEIGRYLRTAQVATTVKQEVPFHDSTHRVPQPPTNRWLQHTVCYEALVDQIISEMIRISLTFIARVECHQEPTAILKSDFQSTSYSFKIF